MTALRPSIPILLLAAIAGGGCGDAIRDTDSSPRPARATETMDQNQAAAAVRDALLDADRRFDLDVAAAAPADRAAVWAAWFAPAGRQLVPGAVVTGGEAIVGLMGPAFADPGFSLRWTPDLGDGAGDWGWTSGRYVSTRQGPDGPVAREGRYLTVWQRQVDGCWKVAVDTGVPDGA